MRPEPCPACPPGRPRSGSTRARCCGRSVALALLAVAAAAGAVAARRTRGGQAEAARTGR